MDKEKIKEIVSRHRHEKAAILEILHEVQEEDRQLDMESQKYIAQLLKVPFANVHGLATFYGAFTNTKKGETQIKVCDGISCHINKSTEVIKALSDRLDIEPGDTSWDEKFSVDRVQCLGLCSIGPNVSFDDETYSNLDREKILEILKNKMGDRE